MKVSRPSTYTAARVMVRKAGAVGGTKMKIFAGEHINLIIYPYSNY